jgi:integrase
MAIIEKVRKTDGVKTYLIDFRDQHGNRVREVAGTTRTQARKLLEQRIGEVRAGIYRNPKTEAKRALEKAGPTFRAVAARFLEDRLATARSDHYAPIVASLVEYFGDRPIRAITPADCDGFRRWRMNRTRDGKRARTISATTLRHNLVAMRTLFKRARQWGLVEHSPAEDVEMPQLAQHRTRFLTEDEYQRLEAACPAWVAPMVRLAVQTGLRLREICEIRWEHVRVDRQLLHLEGENKTLSFRAIRLGSDALRLLNEQPRRSGVPFVFVGPDGAPLRSGDDRNRVSKATCAAAKAAGLTGVSFHVLRHTAASWAVQRGAELFEVQKLLGHSDPKLTMRYAELRPEHLKKVADVLDFAAGGRRMDTQVDTRPGAGS